MSRRLPWDHALVVTSDDTSVFEWRIVVRRTGRIEFEPLGIYAAKYPIPGLVEHVSDGLADEYVFTVSEDKAKSRVVMQPRALPKAPLALPAGVQGAVALTGEKPTRQRP